MSSGSKSVLFEILLNFKAVYMNSNIFSTADKLSCAIPITFLLLILLVGLS